MSINNFNMKSPHFCYEPWVGLDIDNSGLIRPCCKFNHKIVSGWENNNINHISLYDYKNSKELENLKQSFLKGEKPEACERCWKDEDALYPSKRMLDSKRWEQEFNEVVLDNSETLLVTLPLSNICNLKCRICGPNSSSSWIKEHFDLYGEKISNNILNSDYVWKNILNLCDNILEIHVHGGEPFLYDDDKHLELLYKLANSKNANKVRLHYSTNCTVFPDEKYWKLFAKIGHVDIQPSIDDIGKRFEYNRKNANWTEVENNLLLYKNKLRSTDNFQLSISTTVSAFTVFYLDEIFDYFSKNYLPKPWLGRLSKPNYYRCSIFPVEYREVIKQKLLDSKHGDLKNISSWLDEDDSLLLEQFKYHTRLHDQYRNESFDKIFPEIYSWIF